MSEILKVTRDTSLHLIISPHVLTIIERRDLTLFVQIWMFGPYHNKFSCFLPFIAVRSVQTSQPLRISAVGVPRTKIWFYNRLSSSPRLLHWLHAHARECRKLVCDTQHLISGFHHHLFTKIYPGKQSSTQKIQISTHSYNFIAESKNESGWNIRSDL